MVITISPAFLILTNLRVRLGMGNGVQAAVATTKIQYFTKLLQSHKEHKESHLHLWVFASLCEAKS
ncbi:MAG: hypothetical protein WAU00_11760, partial [Caldilinea sp.]|nr:hypothetical protein [Anaerolineales bacterium]